MKLLVKVGGSLVDSPERRKHVAHEIAGVVRAGHRVVVVHGGGRQLTEAMSSRGIESRFVDGLRVTGPETISAVVEVLCGSVNKALVGAIRTAGADAVGISGIDGALADAAQLSPELGQVGKIQSVHTAVLMTLSAGGFVPVVACVAGDAEGKAWNVNADQMAAALASRIEVDVLAFLTDVPGVRGPVGEWVAELDEAQAQDWVRSGVASGGMQAKLGACLSALKCGAKRVVIVSGTEPECLARVVRGANTGTEIVLSAREMETRNLETRRIEK